jgi:hypothetical protein
VYQRNNQGQRYLAETDHLLALQLGSPRSHLSVLLDMDSGGLPYCRIYRDLCHAGEAILPARTHYAVGKEVDQTAHKERWYSTLRWWVRRFTRKTLSFSQTGKNHELVTRWFILEYNRECQMCLAKAAWRGVEEAIRLIPMFFRQQEELMPTKASAAPASIYQLKITLHGSKPPIWRRLQVPSSTSLAKLHDMLQIAMGWTNSHLHQFIVLNQTYSDPSFELEDTLN